VSGHEGATRLLYTGLVVAIDQELIDEIIRRVRSAATPQQIILFGSAAAGRMTRDSDIDLLVPFQLVPPKGRAASGIHRCSRPNGLPIWRE